MDLQCFQAWEEWSCAQKGHSEERARKREARYIPWARCTRERAGAHGIAASHRRSSSGPERALSAAESPQGPCTAPGCPRLGQSPGAHVKCPCSSCWSSVLRGAYAQDPAGTPAGIILMKCSFFLTNQQEGLALLFDYTCIAKHVRHAPHRGKPLSLRHITSPASAATTKKRCMVD